MRNYEKAKKLLNDHVDIMHKIALELLEKEVLNGAEIDAPDWWCFTETAQIADSKKYIIICLLGEIRL